MTTTEIAERSGISPSLVDAISNQTNWDGIDLPTARAYMTACGTDLSNQVHCRRIRVYLKHRPKNPKNRFGYLRKSKEWLTLYLPLVERFIRSVKHGRPQGLHRLGS